mgnify:CR=1 FL=1
MNSVDVVTGILTGIKFSTSVGIQNFDGTTYIAIDKMFWPGNRIAIIESDHVFVFAYEYDISTIPGGVDIVAGSEYSLFLADPEFSKKLISAIESHIEHQKRLL